MKASLASKYGQPMNIPGYNFSELMNFSYNAKMSLNDMILTTLLGYNKVNSGEERDFDATTINALNQGHHASSDSTTIELRLDSDPSIRTPWSVGLYGMRDHGYREDHFTSFGLGVPNFISFGAGAFAYIAGNPGTAISLQTASLPANALTIGTWLQNCVTNNSQCQAYATPAVARPAITGRQYIDQYDVNNFTGAFTIPGVNLARVGLKTQATAVNGNITFPLADNINLLVAGRYSVHDKPYTYEGKTNKTGHNLGIK